MTKKSDTNKAIANLMKWTERPEWSDELGAVFASHLGPENLGQAFLNPAKTRGI